MEYRDRQCRLETDEFCVCQHSFYSVLMRRLADLSGIGPAMLRRSRFSWHRNGRATCRHAKPTDLLSTVYASAPESGRIHVCWMFSTVPSRRRAILTLPEEQRNWWYWVKVAKGGRALIAVHLGERARRDPQSEEVPTRPEGFASIRLLFGGICNTDLELQRGYYGYSGTPGHEFVGEVLEADSRGW